MFNVSESDCERVSPLFQTAEAAKAARAALEFCQMCLLVPKRLIGRVLGNRTNNIVAINEKSGVRHIYLETDPKCLPKVVDQEPTSDGRPPDCVKVKSIGPFICLIGAHT